MYATCSEVGGSPSMPIFNNQDFLGRDKKAKKKEYFYITFRVKTETKENLEIQ
jgi:hypothetical protein